MIGRSSQGRRGSNQSEKATPGEGKKEPPQKLDLKDMPKASARTGHFGCRTAVGEGANMAGRGRARGPQVWCRRAVQQHMRLRVPGGHLREGHPDFGDRRMSLFGITRPMILTNTWRPAVDLLDFGKTSDFWHPVRMPQGYAFLQAEEGALLPF